MAKTKILTEYKKEADLKKEVKKLLDERRAQWVMIVPSGYGKNAVDFIVCYKGRYISIETKIKTNKPTVQQWDWLIETVECGGSSLVAYNLESVEHLLNYIDAGGYRFTCYRTVIEMRKRDDAKGGAQEENKQS